MSDIQANGEDFPLEWFPGQLFPDIELERVEIDDEAIRMVCRDGDWSLQSDITPFWGPGTMVFHTKETPRVYIQEGDRCPEVDRELAQEQLLPHFHTLELVERGEQWRLRGRAGERNAVVELRAEITAITWHADEA
ncbi:hypothetical protein L861_14480 [Litchfieldella anticariensis FP35 = DSM 16096]|uniref:Uncharacterized protein n=1 Tax=Litchfieldella anticariensis (strain DSM 16096 / CECT 5854 / CIP 108499 / LMG 22089 / FP35) TaxID=1121939 RepID=S2KD61_LITA3|nr:hypothetical protein [Halomonas anticariensis]EPC00132.1 hypothetical protein L861_14480 [Halomonas anticariensis FP35 = DSM 16096]